MSEERLGRYILDRRLAAGGMAEVFLARQSGPEGYERTCVIKRMLPENAEDQMFVRMFLDEARLASQLTHPNIAQIYDFGEESEVFFLAMEYVSGANLREVIEHYSQRSTFVPFPATAKIIAEAARALDYAHNAKGQEGEALNIIHRDVSPHNILLSRGGVVKLIDFGIAKTTMANSNKTGVGIIKGKYSYMAPEQVKGQSLDRRTDLYALGLVFYELLTNRRAIRGTDAQTMMLSAAKPDFLPISQFRPDVPERLLKIANRALKPIRTERYSTGLELSDDLERYLMESGQTVGETELTALVPPEKLNDGPRRSGGTPKQTVLEKTPVSKPSRAGLKPNGRALDPVNGTEVTQAAVTSDRRRTAEVSEIQPPAAPPRSRRLGVIVVLALVAIIGGAGAFVMLRSESPQALPPPPTPVAAVRPQAPAPLPVPVAVPPPPPPSPPPEPEATVEQPKDPPAGSKHATHEAKNKHSSHEAHREEAKREEAHPAPAPPEKGTVDFRALPYAEVFLGEKSLGMTPFKPLELPRGHYRFTLTNKATGRSETREVDVGPEKPVVVRVDLRTGQ